MYISRHVSDMGDLVKNLQFWECWFRFWKNLWQRGAKGIFEVECRKGYSNFAKGPVRNLSALLKGDEEDTSLDSPRKKKHKKKGTTKIEMRSTF